MNLPEYDDYFKLLGAYSKRDNKAVAEVINNVYNSGVNFVKWFEGFHSFVMNVVKYIFLQDINLTMIPSHYQEKIFKYGTAHSIVCLKLANKLLKLNYELKTTQYLQEVAQKFSKYYESISILSEKDEIVRKSRLALLNATRTVLANGMKILGVKTLKKF